MSANEMHQWEIFMDAFVWQNKELNHLIFAK